MTLGTPNEAYDASKASNLLSAVGEAVGVAVEELLERGVLSKLVRDPTKHRPGRTLKISDAYALSHTLCRNVRMLNHAFAATRAR